MHMWRLHQADVPQQQDSGEEEVFALPSSGNSDEESNSSESHRSSEESPSVDHLTDDGESMNLDREDDMNTHVMDMSHSQGSTSGEYYNYCYS